MDRAEQEKVRRRFGENLRRWRRGRGFSQESFSFHCGLHRTYVGGIERGERNVALVNIVRIAKALRVPIQALFRGAV